MPSQPTPPQDTMWEAVRRYEKAGFKAGFAVKAAGRIQCLACRREMDAGAVKLLGLHRYEGTSDPEDQAAVAALECPQCRSRGTLVVSYGPMGSAEDKIALSRLDDRRGEQRAGLEPGM